MTIPGVDRCRGRRRRMDSSAHALGTRLNTLIGDAAVEAAGSTRTLVPVCGLKADTLILRIRPASGAHVFRKPQVAFLLVAALALVAAIPAARSQSVFEVPPIALPGPFAVACSNVVQDFSRVGSGESASDYWEGIPRSNGGSRYVTDLLSEPANTLAVTVTAPSDGSLFSSFAGRTIPYVVLVCYPTTSTNPRPDYVLPTGKAIPHMQRGSDAPLLADASSRYPLLLFSHGYGGSPLSDDYIDPILVFASFGYVVAVPFDGDPRIADLVPENIVNLFYLLAHLDNFIAMQALRPLSLSATLDLLLASPEWSAHVDAAKVGGFGASQGGETLLLMAGAALTKSMAILVAGDR